MAALDPGDEMTAGFVSSSHAVIRAQQQRVLFQRSRLSVGAIIIAILLLWGAQASRLLTQVGPSLPFVNGMELCVLVVALTQLHRPWCRRHILGLSVALCLQLVACVALYGLWTGNLWILSLRLSTLSLGAAAVLPWGVAAQGAVIAASSLAFAFVHWSLNGTLDHLSTIPTLVVFALSLPMAFWLEQMHADLACESERRQTAESALRQAIEGTNVAVWDSDIRTGKARLVSGWDRLLGRYENEITLVELLDLVHVDDRARTTVSLQEHLQGRKSTHDIEHRILHADGSYRWVLSRSVITCDAEGRPSRMHGAVMDITDRKRLEEALQDIEARKQVEEVLRDSEELYRGHFEHAAVGKAFCGLDGRYLRVNRRLCDIVGYTEPELCTRRFRDITHPDDLDRDLGYMRDMLDGKTQTHSMEKRYFRKDGSIVWVDVTASLVREPSGKPRYFVSVIEDIDARKRAEDMLRESEERFRGTFEQAAVGIAHVSLDGRWLRVNQQFCEIVGYSEAELWARTFQDVTHPDDLDRDLGYVRDVLDGKIQTYSVEKRYLRKDGSIVWINLTVSLVRERFGNPKYFIAVIEDIDARKRAEDALRASEKKFQGLFESSRDAIMTLEPPSWRFTSGNPATLEMFEAKNEEELISCAPWELSPDRQPDGRASVEKAKEMIETAMREGSYFFEWTHRRLGGEEFPADVLLTRMEQGEKVIVQATVRDITARKWAESERERLLLFLDSIVENIPDMVFVKDAKSLEYLRLNRAAAEILGPRRADLIGKNDYDLLPKEVADFFTEKDRAALHDKNLLDIPEELIKTAQHGERILHTKKIPLLNDKGEPTYLLGISEDITERKRAEEALKLHGTIVDAMAEGVCLIRATDAAIIYANARFEAIFGYGPGELDGKPVATLNASDEQSAEAVVQEIIRALKTWGTWRGEVRNRKKDGTPFWGHSSVSTFQHSQHGDVWVAVHTDITDRKRTEAQLLQANRFLDSIVENIPNTIFVKDAKRQAYVLLNRATEDLFGYRRADVIDKNDYDLFPKEAADAFAKQDRSVLHNRVLLDIPEEPVKTAQRGERIMHTKKIPILNDKGELAYILGIQEDITDRQHAEQMQRRHERATMTINNILRAINTHRDVKAAFPEVCAGLQELGRCAAISLSLFDERQEWLSLAASNAPWALLGAGPGTRLHVTELPGVTDVLAGRPHIIRNLASVMQFPIAGVNYAFGFRSVVNLPLCAGSNVIGLLNLFWREVDGCQSVEMGALTQVANSVAIAVEKSRLFEQVSAGRERLAVLSRRLIEVQEAERRHIARELHDEIGQHLTGINLVLCAVEHLPLEGAIARLQEVRGLVDDLITRVRDVSLDLRPAMLDDLGVLPALLWLFGRYTDQTGITVAFKHRALQQRFTAERETAAYRIVQEALTNVARHAGVGSVNVEAWADDDVLGVSITDQGAGFDVDAVLANGMTGGLSGLRERAMLLGGRLTVESKPGAGTRLIAELPLHSEPGFHAEVGK